MFTVDQEVFFRCNKEEGAYIKVRVMSVDEVEGTVTGMVVVDGVDVAELVWPIAEVFKKGA